MITLISLLASCAFDDDISRVPYTDAAFLLVNDSIEGNKQILKISDGDLAYHWEEKINISGNELGDMSGDETNLWVSSALNQKIYKVEAESEEILEIIDTKEVNPDFICLGNYYLLISDSTNHSISFLDLKSLEISTYSLEKTPGKAIFQSGKFYLIYNDRSLQVYLDQAQTLLSELSLDHPIIDLQADSRISIYAYTEGLGERFETKINYHSDQIVVPATSVTFSKIRFSPYRDQPLGKETLLNIKRIDNVLRLGNKPNCSDFEIDFLESMAYYQNEDSLYMMNALKREISGLGIFRGNFQKTYFRVRY